MKLEESDEAFGVTKAQSHSFSNDVKLSELGATVRAWELAPDDILDCISCILVPEPNHQWAFFFVSFLVPFLVFFSFFFPF